MSLDDKLRAVKSLDDLARVIDAAGTEKPRSIDFNTFMREQFEADRLVAEHFPGKSTVKVMSLFGRMHPALSSTVDAVNLATYPQLVLAVARIVMPGP